MHAVAAALLVFASILTLVCAVGMAVMRDAYQRLHFISPPTAIAAPLVTVAVFLDEPQLQAGFKTLVISLLLFAINAVVTHATARAVRVHERGRWEASPEEHVPIVHNAPKPRRRGRSPIEEGT